MSWLWQPFGADATGPQTISGNLLTNAATFPNATITPGNVTVTGQLLTVTASLPNATVTTQNTITAQLLTNAATFPNATLTPGNVNISTNLLTVTASFPNATITTQYTITANLLSVTASLPNSTVTAAATITANLLSVTASLPNATVTPGNVTVAANLLTVTASLPNATITTGGGADQSVTGQLLTVTASLPNATISATNSIVANLLTNAASLPNATISATNSIVANLLTVTASLPNATVTAAATISANLLTVTASFPLATFSGGLVLHVLQNNCNGGPDETQLSGGSGGNTASGGDYFDTINGGASPSPGDRVVFSSAQKAHGTYSVLCDSNSSGGEYFAWDTSWVDETLQVDVRFYFRVITFPSSAANKMMRLFDNLGNEVAYFRIDAAQQPGIGDSTATFTEPSGPVTLSANTWYRCEMHVPISNSATITADLFDGANMDGTTPDHSWSQAGSDTLTAGGDVASIRFGNSIAGTETYYDEVGIRNDGTAFGPSTDTSTISANRLLVTATFPNATFTTSATISTNLLNWPASFPLASFSQITQITGETLDAGPTFPLASLSITGAQTITSEPLVVTPQVFPASFTLGTINSPGSIEGSVGRRIITVGTVTELEDVAGAVTKG